MGEINLSTGGLFNFALYFRFYRVAIEHLRRYEYGSEQ
jgi:hypothetical protein